MKAGLVMNVFVATAFHKFGGNPHPIKLLITADEEIASPSSRPVIEREGRSARAVFNSEPGRPTGNVVTSRKGGIFMHFAVTGKAAHSGANFAAGVSAIGELAHKIIQIHALTDLTKGITLNVGLVAGGQSVNTTAPYAEGQIDMRYVDPADRATVMAEIERIVATPYVPGTSAVLTIKGEFAPVVQSEELEGAVRTLSGGRKAGRPHHAPGRVLRRLRRFRLHRRGRHADDLRRRTGRRLAHRRRNISSSTASCRARRRWRSRFCEGEHRCRRVGKAKRAHHFLLDRREMVGTAHGRLCPPLY